MKLGDLVAHTAAATPDGVAVIETAHERSITYLMLADLVEETSAALLATGLTPGDVVGLRAPNTLAYIVGLLGAARAGWWWPRWMRHCLRPSRRTACAGWVPGRC